MPCEKPEAATRRFTSEVMFTHSVRRDVFTRSVSMHGRDDSLPVELMSAHLETREKHYANAETDVTP